MRITCTTALLLYVCSNAPLAAQDWTVGTGVHEVLTQLPMVVPDAWTDDCDSLRWRLRYLESGISGVQQYWVVSTVEPPWVARYDSVTGTPVLVGDTLIVDPPYSTLLHFLGAGQVLLDWHVYGVPTMVGQPHPCMPQSSLHWNTLFSPCGLISRVTWQDACTTQSASSVADLGGGDIPLVMPHAGNGHRLMLSDGLPAHIRIHDAIGRTVQQAERATSLSCAGLPRGAYLYLVEREGTVRRGRFHLGAH